MYFIVWTNRHYHCCCYEICSRLHHNFIQTNSHAKDFFKAKIKMFMKKLIELDFQIFESLPVILQRWKKNIRLLVIFKSILMTAPSPWSHYGLHHLDARSLSLGSAVGSVTWVNLWRFHKRLHFGSRDTQRWSASPTDRSRDAFFPF